MSIIFPHIISHTPVEVVCHRAWKWADATIICVIFVYLFGEVVFIM